MADDLLTVRELVKHFPVRSGIVLARGLGTVHAVDGVSFAVAPGETFGLVGESGCGKSTVARLLLRLMRPTAGNIFFEGRDVMGLRGPEFKEYRRSVQMVFQDPATSLDPRMSVFRIVAEPLAIHGRPREERRNRVGELLDLVGLSPAFVDRYPHELSGGERQRVAIARALALGPRLVIGDEPVSALDASVRAQILDLLNGLKTRFRLAYLFISHDLAVVRHLCDRVAVMYLGKIVELAETGEIFSAPKHPYTESLLSAVPLPDPKAERARSRMILTGEVPSALAPPPGCRFNTRCPIAQPLCLDVEPPLVACAPGRLAACHFARTFPVKSAGGAAFEGMDTVIAGKED